MTASFTDPGRADTQTGEVNWGDATVEDQAKFSLFTDARRQHRHPRAHAPLPGSGDYTLELSVKDKDLGEDVESTTVRVLTPAQALAEILQLLDAAIAGAPNPAARGALVKARLELVGRERAEDGALRMLDANRPDAAAAFVLQASTGFRTPDRSGARRFADHLLQQVYASLTAACP